jgi:hypothetical protein
LPNWAGKERRNLFVTLEYDGTLHTNGGSFRRTLQDFGVISGTTSSAAAMQRYLGEQSLMNSRWRKRSPRDKCLGGRSPCLGDVDRTELPSSDVIAGHLLEQLGGAVLEAAVLENASRTPVTWRVLREEEIRPILDARM